MSLTRFALCLIVLSLLLCGTFSYAIEGLFPDAGPTDGYTRVTVYSSTYAGLNYSSHPRPLCQFGDSEPEIASWIHCAGYGNDTARDETCLNCQSTPHAAGNATVKVSIRGDFTDTAQIQFHYYEPPEVFWAEPFIGKKPGGTLVHVHGKNFENLPALGCVFGSIIVPAKFISTSIISCRSPKSAVVDAVIPLKVTQNVQQSSQSWIKYYYYSVPEVSQLIPDNGPTTGGTEVYIKGRQMYPFQVSDIYIDNTTFARFGRGHYVRATLINTTHAKAISPPSLIEGPVPVEITFNDQEWTKDGIPFTYYIPPYVLELIPNFGAVQGGTNVTVVGASFYNTSDIKCRFGTNVVPGYYIDATRIWCVTPAALTSGYVDFGLALTQDRYSGNELKYLYIDPPVITSLTPMCGPTTGYTQIKVVGKNFVYIGLNKALCIFGDFKQSATVVNETLIYCDSPSVLDKFGNNPNNISSLPLKLTLNQVDFFSTDKSFTYYTMPTLTPIVPLAGPISGGTNVVAQVKNISDYCDLSCRFGTMEVPGRLTGPNEVTCVSPAVTCPGNTVVQVSLNRQQYTLNDYNLSQTVFYYYQSIVVAYVSPDSIPTAGGSQVTVYGEGFLLSRNSTTAPDGSVIISYFCRFSQEDGTVIETSRATYVDNNIIKCTTPKVDSPIDNAILEVSPNGQNWEPVIFKNVSFYRAPEVISVDPKFGKIKQNGTELNVYGKYFDCPDSDCSNVKCAFVTPDMRVVSDGERQSSTQVVCQIPPISRPEVTIVQVTMNGIDYTTQNVTYTFYDAFVLSIDPPYVPVEGNTIARLIGYGFADTGEVKVQLLDGPNGGVLLCRGYPCILDGTYISQSEVQFTVPPQADVRDASGNSIGFKPFVAEVSIYGDSFTRNGVQIQYFEQPVVGALTSDGSPFSYHTNAVETVRVPVTLRIPEGTTKANFLNFAKIRCRFQVQQESVDTVGVIVDYPFPVDPNLSTDQLSRIECPTPRTNNVGDGTVSVSLNGRDFVGNNAIRVMPELKLLSVAPQCGPKEGGTAVSMAVQGFDNDDAGKIFFTWSTVCTDALTMEMMIAPNTLATVTPPVAYLDTSPGGTSLAVFSVNKIIDFNNGSQSLNARNYLDSSAEFVFYRVPSVVHTYPHSGNAAGGTPVIVDGAFFFTDPTHSCTPKCKFGDQIVEAEFISTVRLRCLSPAGREGVVVPLTITMNGKDETPIVQDQTFTFTTPPVIESIHPRSGPTSGGTPILVSGQRFVDLSSYPAEFLCRFTSSDTRLPAKTTPASFLNDTAIMCTSPGGWSAGNIAKLQISYNGVDFSNDNNTFRFYQVDTIYPLSGPAVGGTNVTIIGSGFQTEAREAIAACKISGKETPAISVNWTAIVCVVPPAPQGPTYYGHEQFFYTLDSVDWHQIVQGYTYYEQPLVSQLIPPWIPKEGGRITVRGEKFITDWYGTVLTCRIGNSVVFADYLNSTHINCTFRRIDVPDTAVQYLQVAMNEESYTAGMPASRIYVFYVTKMTPESGVLEGGTQIQLQGVNFPPNAVPLCRFGIKSRSAITFGNRVSQQQLVCTSPPGDPPSIADYPLEILFSLNFDKDTYKTWAWEGMHYYYYRQPEIKNVEPKSALLDQNTMVTITSSPEHPFNDSLIGSLVTHDVTLLSTNIVCRWGRFGTSKGALLSHTQVNCPTPSTKLNLEEVGEEPVKVEVAMNGQDFDTQNSVYFKFVGTKSPTNYGIIWILAIIIGAAVLLFLLYFISKAFAGTSGVSAEQAGLIQKSPNRGGSPGPRPMV